MNEVVKVPQTPGPKKQLCWYQDWRIMSPHCDRVKGHGGMHTFELVARIKELEQK